jgi:hypothetical protein
LKDLGVSFCSGLNRLREVSLPPTLKLVGPSFLFRSSMEGLDLSKTSLQDLGDSFCECCEKLREVLLPRTLMFFGSLASADHPLAFLVLPVGSGMGIGVVYSAAVLSGLVGLGSVLARPMWPAE